MRRRGILVSALGALALHAGGGSASATFTQEPGSPYTVGANPYGVVVSDFNADNRPDVATVNGTSSSLSVLLRQPGGGFAEELGSPIAVGTGPNYGVAADFNADSRPDIAVSNFVTGNATVLLRQAGGGFAQEMGSPFGAGGRASAIATADFNGDTRPDLALSNYDVATLTVLLRQPGGGFMAEVPAASTGTTPGLAAAADFNADGRPDLAVTNRGSGNVSILLRNAGSGFTPEVGSPVSVGADPLGIVADDFNADGRPDLAVTNWGSHTVSVLLRQASGGFAPESGSPISVGLGPIGVTTSDFNGDGARDLAVTNNTASSVTVLLRATGGGFGADPSSPVATANGAYGVKAADFDADGRQDLAIANDQASNMTVLLNTTPPGTPPPSAPPPGGPPAATPPAQTPTPTKRTRRIRVSVTNTFGVRRGAGTKVITLTVRGVPVGARVELRCRGRSCPFKKAKRYRRRGPNVKLARAFRGRRLAAGSRIEIRVTAPNAIGSVTRFRVRSYPKLPKKSSLCLRPGAKTPTRRC